ncbi:glycosyltransferase family 8 protein [Catenovulum sp. 2E275]|uniref:glycosyltransferase family 8 protein n=1 Tax=Catenovulum sp. 2E275 TaxID=2980497 RepID=UPI0021CE755F|nr:glycosyltransferase family 8 protein [Catenovulum sp. 2E275]MCU4676920.1 glycosyltransferase family 8 protein [Catenovulum sp. 2E275]
MVRIPVVFAFDNNLATQAAICFKSLLECAQADTFYEIIVLYCDLNEKNQQSISQLTQAYSQFSLQFIDCRHLFAGGFETRGITSSTYLRLWIPELLKPRSRVLYCDVDIIFRTDLTELFNWDIGDACFAGVKSPPQRQAYAKQQGWGENYINAGVLIMQLDSITTGDINQACQLAKNNQFKYQDQDIINSVFADKIYSGIPPVYNFSPNAYRQQIKNRFLKGKANQNLNTSAIKIIHYIGIKPWQKNVYLGEYWWKTYLDSFWYDDDFYQKYCFDLQQTPSLKKASRSFLKALFGVRY